MTQPRLRAPIVGKHDHGHEGHDHGTHDECDPHGPRFLDCDHDADHASPGGAVHVNVPVLLPGVADERDSCIGRLQAEMKRHKGIETAHVESPNGATVLCLHYDTEQLTIADVRKIAEKAGATVSKRYRHELLWLQGMDCADCGRSVEHILQRVPGVLDVNVNYAAERIRLEYDAETVPRERLVKRIEQLGYTVERLDEAQTHDHAHGPEGLTLPLLCGALLAVAWLGSTFFGLPVALAVGLYAGAYVAGGYDAARHGLAAAFRLRLDIDVLMVVAALGAAVLGEWAEGALLLFLFSFGHALEHAALDKARNAIQGLGQLTPKTARIRRDGREIEIGVAGLLRGDVAIVRPGERIPVEGVIRSGESAVDQSPITGESIPVDKRPEDTVFAGSVNGEGVLEVEVTKLAKDTTLARVVKLVQEAQVQKSPTQRFTDRFSRIFVPTVLAAVALVVLVPPLVGAFAGTTPLAALALPWQESFLRGMTILVAASPCALAISTPSAILSGIGQAARHGVLIKGGVHLENLGEVRTIAFDQTGTLTLGRPTVTDVVPSTGVDARRLLQVAASVESRSKHPLAQAIVAKARADDVTLLSVGNVESSTGRGILGLVEGRIVRVGSPKLFPDLPRATAERMRALEQAGRTVIAVQEETTFLGVIALADTPRPEARGVLDRLRRLGVRDLVLITGDNERVARAVARDIGLTEVKADRLPDQKADAIREILRDKGKVAMVGDGVNDAPALAHATVGIAMGAGGTDVALETADVALMGDDLKRLPYAIALSRESRRIIKQNLVISLGVIALLVPAALFGWAGIGVAIVFHEGSTLLVVANALRLLRFRDEDSP